MPDRKSPDERISEDCEKYRFTSHNAYLGDAFLSASQLAPLLHLTATRIRQIANEKNIGQRVGKDKKFLLFSPDDFIVLAEAASKRMSKHAKEGPRTEPLAGLSPVDAQQLRSSFEDMMSKHWARIGMTLHDILIGTANRITKLQDAWTRRFMDLVYIYHFHSHFFKKDYCGLLTIPMYVIESIV